MRDVAREAGVSHMTVSRVFAGHRGVGAATRQRVLAAAQRLGYRPNTVARSLARARTHTLGIVMSRHAPFADALVGAEDEAVDRGYSFLYTTPNLDPTTEQRHIEVLLERRVDGLLIMASSAAHTHDHLLALHSNGVPLVTINRYCEEMGFWRLFYDYRGAARGVVRRWLAQGRRSVAFLGGSPDHAQYAVKERIEGYREALREAGLWLPELECFGGTSPHDGDVLVEALLERCPHVAAILVVNDSVAAGALRTLARLGRRVPEDVAVVGFDNTMVGPCTAPPLSSVRHASYEAGRMGCRLLIEQIERNKQEAGTLYLPSALMVRHSCGLSAGMDEEGVLPLE